MGLWVRTKEVLFGDESVACTQVRGIEGIKGIKGDLPVVQNHLLIGGVVGVALREAPAAPL